MAKLVSLIKSMIVVASTLSNNSLSELHDVHVKYFSRISVTPKGQTRDTSTLTHYIKRLRSLRRPPSNISQYFTILHVIL